MNIYAYSHKLNKLMFKRWWQDILNHSKSLIINAWSTFLNEGIKGEIEEYSS